MRFFARTTYLSVCLFLTLFTLVTCGGGGGGSGSGQTSNPVPSLTSISPTYTNAGGPAFSLIVTGSSFVSSSVIEWNNAHLSTTYVNSTTLTAFISSADLQNTEMVSVTVTNPSPGGGTSNAMEFSVGANGQVSSVVNVIAVDLAWDPINQVIYFSSAGVNGATWNSVQILDPATGSLGASAPAGSEPYSLSVSATSQYLYVAQAGASTVQALTLPGLGTGFTIDLGGGQYGPFSAMDLQASPNSDSLVAVVRGASGISPVEEGGVVIYDSGTALPDALCGFVQSGCTGPSGALYDSIQWNSSGTEMFAVNNETTSFDFYTMQVNSSGFGTITDYPGVLTCFGCLIHYDATTGYVYYDNGQVVNPANGELVGAFGVTGIGLMIPDGAHGQAFFIEQTAQNPSGTTYTIESFDIQKFIPLSSMTISNVPGVVTSFIRWGKNGLAFAANNAEVGAVYLITGPFVGGAADRSSPPEENVHRAWKARGPLHRLRLTKADDSRR